MTDQKDFTALVRRLFEDEFDRTLNGKSFAERVIETAQKEGFTIERRNVAADACRQQRAPARGVE